MADIETRLRRLLKVNAAVVGHIHVQSVLSRLAASALELTGAGYAAVRVADAAPIEAVGPGDAAARSRTDAVEVPLTVRGEPFATLVVAGHPAGEFTGDDIELLHSLASTAGIALDKARTYEATRQRERWAQAKADVRAAESVPAATAALLSALPALTGSESAAEATVLADRSVALALPGVAEPVIVEGQHPLAVSVSLGRAGRVDGVRGAASALVFPLRDPGQAVVILRAAGVSPLDAEEIARVAELVEEAAGAASPDAASLGLYEELSPRERDVLLLIADGLSNRQIAERLFLSEKTVKNHVTALLRKMGMERRTQAAVYGAQLRDA